MIVYKITNKINGKIYIGQTVLTLVKRKKGHIADSKRDRKSRIKSKISKAIAKYGIDNFVFEIIHETTSMDELNYLEEKYISELKSNNDNIGYNLLSGGHQNGKQSEETKQKISEWGKKNPCKYWLGKKQSKESNIKRSLTLQGKPCPQRGHRGIKNPMKNPLTVVKMVKTRTQNRLIKLQEIKLWKQ